jgi:putative nucleotidyltransferase with HDIG domain
MQRTGSAYAAGTLQAEHMNIIRRRWTTALSYTLTARPRTMGSGRGRLIFALEALLLMLGIWAALTLRLPGDYGQLTLGQPSPYSIQAPNSATFDSDVKTAEARNQAEARAENQVYLTDLELPIRQRNELRSLFGSITSVRDEPGLGQADRIAKLASLPNPSIVISDTVAVQIVDLSPEEWQKVESQSLALYDRALNQYDYAIDERALAQLYDASLPYWVSIAGMSSAQSELSLLFTKAFLRVNRTLDPVSTDQKKAEARGNVLPVKVQVLAGENIVRVGEIVTPDMIEKLQATGAVPRDLNWLSVGGRGLLAALLAAGFMAYMTFFQLGIASQPRTMLVIIMLLLLLVILAPLIMPISPEQAYAMPVAALGLVFAVVFNGQLALIAVMLVSLVIGMTASDTLTIMVTLLFSGSVAVFMVRDADKLLTFLLAGIGVALTVIITQLAFWLVGRTSLPLDDLWRALMPMILLGGLNGGLSAIIALGVFNLVGRAAGVVTPIQLMELAHPSRPLLRKLIREAPGTYYHSVAVGNLAEAAAEAIGADALLLRVAAYYHDIGKTIRPYFFTDNQMGRENVHNELDPHTSAQIIVDHVREGAKMARAAGLPEQIVGFIATHHGTGLIKQFYQLALQQQDSVDIADFRYPGPRPQSREQGILMLADSVEATVRSKAQNGKLIAMHAEAGSASAANGSQTLEELINSIIDTRMREGELDQTPLTIRDIALIKQTFLTNLRSIYHPRVDYAPQVMR